MLANKTLRMETVCNMKIKTWKVGQLKSYILDWGQREIEF